MYIGRSNCRLVRCHFRFLLHSLVGLQLPFCTSVRLASETVWARMTDRQSDDINVYSRSPTFFQFYPHTTSFVFFPSLTMYYLHYTLDSKINGILYHYHAMLCCAVPKLFKDNRSTSWQQSKRQLTDGLKVIKHVFSQWQVLKFN